MFKRLPGSVEAQLKKALTIAVRAQANREKRKANNLDDSASPHEKLQRFTEIPLWQLSQGCC